MKVKAKDIAKAAGVSTTAVSLVLNGKDSRISEATKEKILRISREMAFQSEISSFILSINLFNSSIDIPEKST